MGVDGGEKLYNGVWFNKYGFPDFEKMGQTLGEKYNFKDAKGNYTDDFTNARDWLKKQDGIEEIKDLAKGSPLLVKINGKWEKITWHHHEDGKTRSRGFAIRAT
ncbi:HNH endonuclease [Empedobacter stercoris]|uniref:HNH endonuclease n=1 Tax=Empedobacter stercoris TaxID=1628248 RepID=UPI0021AFEC2E|nr:HNH endonuclease [Empedobacter stercoris]UWX66884.1 HNH endonuclease [Empedobacter stercoris]